MMKKSFIFSLVFAFNVHLMQATVPYYMQNPDSSKIDAIKNDDAKCGCSGDCNGGNIENSFSQQNERNGLSDEKIDATQAKCGCGGDCNGGQDFELPSTK